MTNAMAPAGELVLVGGPDGGRTVAVPATRVILGRASDCEITVRDPEIEPHHVLLEVGEFGVVRLTQLAGRLAMVVDGRPMATATLANDEVDLEIGATRLMWQPINPDRPRRGHGTSGRGIVLGVVDRGDRAFGIDAAQPAHDAGRCIELLDDVDRLLLRGRETGPCLRSLLGQLVAAGWAAESCVPAAPCSIEDGQRRVVATGPGARVAATDADLVITVADEGTADPAVTVAGLTEDAVDEPSSGAVIEVGPRSRGRYIADVNQFATTRVHLVGWHPTTFRAALARR